VVLVHDLDEEQISSVNGDPAFASPEPLNPTPSILSKPATPSYMKTRG